jgi:hypothetical protein
MAEIYALYSTRDGRVRYVGQSGDCAALRFKEHLRSWGCPLKEWFHREWRDGYLVRYAVLETCDYDMRHGTETTWIWRFPSSDLLNRHKQRPWYWQTVRPPVIPVIKKYMRRHSFNVEGFRGVSYDHDVGYYRVLVYSGSGVRWLRGDELPGGSADIWFSDLARALNVRDGKYPHRLRMQARRWKDIIASRAREQERIREEGYYNTEW